MIDTAAIRQRYELIAPHLDERGLRLFVASEARAAGHGGIAAVSLVRLEPVLARHGGRLVELTGDGALVEFPSAVDALGAAIEFQQAMAETTVSPHHHQRRDP